MAAAVWSAMVLSSADWLTEERRAVLRYLTNVPREFEKKNGSCI